MKNIDTENEDIPENKSEKINSSLRVELPDLANKDVGLMQFVVCTYTKTIIHCLSEIEI